MRPVAVVVSRYPSVSHTFIRREVEALREAGVDVRTVSIRPPPPEELLTDADRAEDARTWHVLPASPVAVAGALLAELGRAPGRLLATLRFALGHRPPGAGSRLYGLFYLAEAALLARHLRAADVGHVHAHFANVGGEVGLLASRLLGTGFSLTLHGHADFSHPEENRLREKLAAARFAVCVSDFGREALRELAAPGDAQKIHVVRCGLAAEMLALPERPPPGGRLRLLCVGRLAPEKAHGDLLEAFAQARARGLDAELRIVGEGPERAALEARRRALGLEEDCSLPGALGGEALAREYDACHAFVLSSRVEGLPVVIMEAFAHGRPVVAPRLAGIPELVRDGESGWLFPPGDLAALAEALLAVSREREHLAGRGAAGRRVVREQHDVRRGAAVLAGLFAQALGPR